MPVSSAVGVTVHEDVRVAAAGASVHEVEDKRPRRVSSDAVPVGRLLEKMFRLTTLMVHENVEPYTGVPVHVTLVTVSTDAALAGVALTPTNVPMAAAEMASPATPRLSRAEYPLNLILDPRRYSPLSVDTNGP
jgi:hypothetical protein